tara:strand:+ start:12796 stop:14655 length:1860 start_codon:yes stop_codon:yes gene_type:complete
MATVNRDVKYLNRDFSDIRAKLIEFSKTYFPNTYNDFSPTSPGMMFMEQAAYVGDVMSFYLDNQLQETFTQFSRQTNNLYELAYMFGYKPKTTGAAQAVIELFQQVPSKLSGTTYVPDMDYALTIGENSTIASSLNTNVNFLMEDQCDFAVSSSLDPTEVSIYQISGEIPQYYLLKKTRKAISATINTQTFSFGSPEQFPTVDISAENIIGILDITDSDGNTWYEVDYLAQEMVYDNIKNTNTNDPNNVADVGDVPYLLQLKKVQRRFATRFTSDNNLQIQFGAGNPNDVDEVITPDPNNVGIGLPFEKNKLTTAYSPTNFLFTNTYGIAPSSTTLTVRYLTGGGVEANTPSGDLTTLDTTNLKFNNPNLNATTANYIFSSIAANNPDAADGGQAGDTTEEIRQNTISSISAQQRSVTLDDYIVRALSMPSEFGTIAKAYIEKPKLTDEQVSTIETLNLFALSQNLLGQFSTPTQTLKKNLRTYLSQFRIIGDNIEIRDAFVINIAVDFEIIVLPNFNNNDIILACINSLKSYFARDNWQINQPILLRDLFVRLDKIKGVQTVKDIKIINKAGTTSGYSQYAYDISSATQNQVIYPSLDPSIFEVKYPNSDIKGRVVPL